MSTKYLYHSYLQTDVKKINLTAYSDNNTGINAWSSRYALRKAAEGRVRRLHAYATNRSWRWKTARASSLTEHGPKRSFEPHQTPDWVPEDAPYSSGDRAYHYRKVYRGFSTVFCLSCCLLLV